MLRPVEQRSFERFRHFVSAPGPKDAPTACAPAILYSSHANNLLFPNNIVSGM